MHLDLCPSGHSSTVAARNLTDPLEALVLGLNFFAGLFIRHPAREGLASAELAPRSAGAGEGASQLAEEAGSAVRASVWGAARMRSWAGRCEKC